MTKEQTIKALECCIDGRSESCVKCVYAYVPFPSCKEILLKSALSLILKDEEKIKTLKGRINALVPLAISPLERLKKEIDSMEYKVNSPRKTFRKEELIEQVNWVLHTVIPDAIYKILKEITEVTE